jgi:hypothetical protein
MQAAPLPGGPAVDDNEVHPAAITEAYYLILKIGEGTFGDVYKAIQRPYINGAVDPNSLPPNPGPGNRDGGGGVGGMARLARGSLPHLLLPPFPEPKPSFLRTFCDFCRELCCDQEDPKHCKPCLHRGCLLRFQWPTR